MSKLAKYRIVDKENGRILCKSKIFKSRRYRQSIDHIDKNLVIVETTKGRAEQERDFLIRYDGCNWEIELCENTKE